MEAGCRGADENADPRKLPEELREKTQVLLLREGEFEEKEWQTALRELEELEVRERIAAGRGRYWEIGQKVGGVDEGEMRVYIGGS